MFLCKQKANNKKYKTLRNHKDNDKMFLNQIENNKMVKTKRKY